jgi:hypothetical protein
LPVRQWYSKTSRDESLEALVSPILVRPVREQLEHDRVIRLLQTKARRRYEVGANPGAEQNVPLRAGSAQLFPDLLLFSQGRGRKLQAIVEVETGESVNHLEALAQWAHLAKLRAPFFLYVPAGMVDVARRLCEDNQIQINEIWSYHAVGDQVRFTLVHRTRETAASARSVRRPRATPVRRPPVRSGKSDRSAKPPRKSLPQKRR